MLRAPWLAGLVLLAASAAACRDDALPPPPPAARVTVDMDSQRAMSTLPDPNTPTWALSGTWAVHETRDAWTSEFAREIVVPVRVHGAIDVTSAAAIEVDAGGDVDDVFVECEMRLRTQSGDTRIAQSRRSAHDAAHQWAELHGRVVADPAQDPRLVFVARVVRGERTLPATARARFAVPRVVPVGARDAAGGGASKSPLNVLVISVDTLRADHLGCYGYARPTSPRIDALAARGVRFENAISPAPWTLPAYGSLFTGLLPARHRAGVSVSREANFADGRAVEKGDMEFLAPSAVTVAQLLADRGFATAAFVSNPFLDAQTGVDRGFQSWTQYLNRAQAGVELAQRWIEARGDTPWFLFLHLMDPHSPYAPPAPYDERFAGVSVGAIRGYPPSLESVRAGPVDAASRKLLMDLYDGEIAYTDEWIGKLVDFLDARQLTEHTLIVLHADHGEEFWEHGGYEHGHALYDEVLRVPLVFVLPKSMTTRGGSSAQVPSEAGAGHVITTRTSTVDVGPTILDLCGVDRPRDLDGVSLVPGLDGARGPTPAAGEGTPSPRRDCISEALLYADHESKALSRGDEKVICDAAGRDQLYALGADPRERHDLAADRAARAAELRAVLTARARAILSRATASGPLDLSQDRLDALQKFGYPGDSLGKKRK